MAGFSASGLLRADLLNGVRVMLAGTHADGTAGSFGPALSEAFSSLGATVCEVRAQTDEEASLDRAVAEIASAGGVDLLAIDCAGVFTRDLARHGEEHRALRACVDYAWNVTRAAAHHAFLDAGRGGRVVYVAPAGSGAARAALENLTRTLSVEWARHQITTVTIAPASSDVANEVAALAAYLASPAGAYFSGCLLEIGGIVADAG